MSPYLLWEMQWFKILAEEGTPIRVLDAGRVRDLEREAPAALAVARTLVTDLGCEPVEAGGLARAGLLEATAAFAIGLWFTDADPQAIFPPLAHAAG